MSTQQDGPIMDLEQHRQEASDDLWILRSLQPSRPVGEENVQYVCPSKRWLPLIQEALKLLQQAKELALAEVPAQIARQAAMIARRDGGGWEEVAKTAPEARRFCEVLEVTALVETLTDELTNEGRPRPPYNLKLARVRPGM